MSVEVIRAAALGQVPHGFLGRRGGVSGGILEGLNVGYGSSDDRATIDENRRRAIAAVLPGAELATVHQVHSGDVVVVERPWPNDRRPAADAMVTNRPGLLLGILTADCAPVLLADLEAQVVGAAHAGWRGGIGGVTQSAITAMEWLGAKRHRIVAAIGPCIGQASYEVDRNFRKNVVEHNDGSGRFFRRPLIGKPRFDLPGFIADQLRSSNVAHVEVIGLDTYGDAARFFSYRRSTHRGEPDYGRQISVIGLAP